MKTIHWIAISAFLAIVVLVLIFPKGNLGGMTAIDVKGNATGTSVIVQTNIATQVLAAKSGRVWFRLSNTASSSLFYCALSSTSTNVLINTGIVLYATSSSRSVFDSAESEINWEGAVFCIANATGTVSAYQR